MRQFSIFALGLLASLAAEASVLSEQARRYPLSVDYEVFRNEKPVGQYRIRFELAPDQLAVDVHMQISTRIFGLFSYDYNYKAREVWRADQLLSLEVSMLTNGELETIEAQREGERLRVKDQKGRVRDVSPSLLTTHHWFDTILQQREVLNTLTGEVSRIAVKPEADAVWMINGESVEVRGFRLGGDLKHTLSWYDQKGIWRGMSFKAKDGSIIDVRWQGAQL